MSLGTFCNLLPSYVFSIHRCFVGSVRGEHLWVFSSVFVEKLLTSVSVILVCSHRCCLLYSTLWEISEATMNCIWKTKLNEGNFRKKKTKTQNKVTLLKLNFSIPYILCKDFFRFPPPPPSLWFPVYLSCHTLCYLDELSDFIFYLLKLLTFSLRLSPLFFSLTLEGVCLLVQIKPPTTVLHLIEWFLNRLVDIFLNFWTTQFAFLFPPPLLCFFWRLVPFPGHVLSWS